MDFKNWYSLNCTNANWHWLLKKLDLEQYEKIAAWEGDTFSEKICLFLREERKRPKCFCGQEVCFYKTKKDFAKYCSPKCSTAATAGARSITLKNKTIAEKKIIFAKAKNTSILKYGEDYATTRAKKRSKETLAKMESARKKAMMEKYGFDNPSYLAISHSKRRITYRQRSEEQRKITAQKTEKTRIKNGTSLPNDHPSILGSFKQYTRRVRYLTNKNIKNAKAFQNRSKDRTIDHIFSIFDGFKYQINPEVIANLKNLRLLSRSENSKKHSKSDLAYEELIRLI